MYIGVFLVQSASLIHLVCRCASLATISALSQSMTSSTGTVQSWSPLGARDGQNLISWKRSLPLPTNPVWWGSMHAISSYRGNRPTHPHTHTHSPTNRQDRLQYTTLQLARSVTKTERSNGGVGFITTQSLSVVLKGVYHPSISLATCSIGRVMWNAVRHFLLASAGVCIT